jgi:uncharacterized membrane protein
MNKTTLLINSAVTGLLALSLTMSENAVADKAGFEKCAGLVKAGKNDCGTSGHSCAGQAKADRGADEWLYLPIGTCEKIAGGTVVAKK